jgi:hypothetical protein
MRAQLFPHKTAASKNKSFLNEKIMKFVLKIKEGVSAVKRMMLGREKRLWKSIKVMKHLVTIWGIKIKFWQVS